METIETGGKSAAHNISFPLLFVVLVPHHDCLSALEAYRRRLFASGLNGAFSFPAAAPLALLGRPLDSTELKSAAAELRNLLGDKKIVSCGQGECEGWTDAGSQGPGRFFGPVLELPLPAFPADAVLRRWERPILAPALVAPGCSIPQPEDGSPAAFLTSRAMALANCALFPVSGGEAGFGELSFFDVHYSFTWKIGPLFWLPRYSKKGG